MPIRIKKIMKEFDAAALPVEGVTSGRGAIHYAEIEPDVFEDCIIDYAPEATPADVAAAEAIKAAHDPVDYEALREAAAEGQVAAIPGWASWTEAEVLNWHDTNIADPLAAIPDIDTLNANQFQNNAQDIMAAMQDVINALETENRAKDRIIVALRNKIWPGLEGN